MYYSGIGEFGVMLHVRLRSLLFNQKIQYVIPVQYKSYSLHHTLEMT
jgi:hypothetical protein